MCFISSKRNKVKHKITRHNVPRHFYFRLPLKWSEVQIMWSVNKLSGIWHVAYSAPRSGGAGHSGARCKGQPCGPRGPIRYAFVYPATTRTSTYVYLTIPRQGTHAHLDQNETAVKLWQHSFFIIYFISLSPEWTGIS